MNITIDESSQVLYVSDQDSSSVVHDAVYALQLNTAGDQVTLANTYSLTTLDGSTVTEGTPPESHPLDLAFDQLPVLSVSGTSSQARANSSAITLASATPTITDQRQRPPRRRDGADHGRNLQHRQHERER